MTIRIDARKSSAGYGVRLDGTAGLIAWVAYSAADGYWESFCSIGGCRGHSVAGSKVEAGEQASEHYAIEHR